MDVDLIPKRVTKQYLSSLTNEEREFVENYKKEQHHMARLHAQMEYQKRHKEKVNAYHRNRRQLIKELNYTEKDILLKKIDVLLDDSEKSDYLKNMILLLSSDDEEVVENAKNELRQLIDE